MKTGIELIADERQRQIDKKNWTADHDDEHTDCSLAMAAALYATPQQLFEFRNNGTQLKVFEDPWPWRRIEGGRGGGNAWDRRGKSTRIRDLEKAGALIAAEIDRLQRIDKNQHPKQGKE